MSIVNTIPPNDYDLIESVVNKLAPSAQEDARNLFQAFSARIGQTQNSLGISSGTSQANVAAPPQASLAVRGGNGTLTFTITNPKLATPATLWHEISYSPVASFASDVTTLPPTQATSIAVNAPGLKVYSRIRSSVNQAVWNNYAVQTAAVDAGLVSSEATNNAGAFNQTNYGVVSSRAVGSTAEVTVQGANGPLTSMVTQKGPVQKTLPGATIYGVTPASNQFIVHNGDTYAIRPTLAAALAEDSNTPIGAVSVVGTGEPRLPVIVPIVVQDSVVGYNVTDGGAGASAPYELTVSGKGIGATCGAQTIANGVLTAVAPGNPGGGYKNDGSTTVTAGGGVATGSNGGGTAVGNNGGRLVADPGASSPSSSTGGAVTPPSGAANQVYATPNGAAGSAGLRTLVAADLPGSVLTNPMEDVGDLIVGGAAGAPTRLPAGAAGYVLQSGGPGVAPSYQPGAGGGGRGLFSSIMSAVPTIASVGLTTAWNQTGTFSAVDLADGILISDGAQGTIWEGILKAYPTPPFTVVGMFTIPIDQGAFTNVLMSVVDTLTGKFMMLRREGGANASLSIYGATAPGSGGSYTNLFSKGSLFTSFFIFIKYVDDGTTIKISFSYDGQYWPASFTYSVAKASSYLGSTGFNYIGIGISPASAPTATQLMSWTQTSP